MIRVVRELIYVYPTYEAYVKDSENWTPHIHLPNRMEMRSVTLHVQDMDPTPLDPPDDIALTD